MTMSLVTREQAEEYTANIKCDTISPNPTPYLNVLEGKFYHAKRLSSNIPTIKATNFMQRRGMIASCIKVSFGGGSNIIGYVYSEPIYKPSPKLGAFTGDITGGDDSWFIEYLRRGAEEASDSPPEPNFIHRHICYGPTYNSQDGEFRGRFIQWEQMQEFYRKYSDACNEIEKIVIARMDSRAMYFHVDMCYPNEFKDRKMYEDSINNTRICIKMFTLCWLVDMYEIYFEIDANHMNQGYYSRIYTPEEAIHFENILRETSRPQYRDLIYDACRITDNMGKYTTLPNPQLGQKIFTLPIIEAASPWDLNFPFWRELYATKKCAELALSLVCVGFPILIDWFHIANTHAGIYDTYASHERFAHSARAAEIDQRLKNIDDMTHIDAARENAFISTKFHGMSDEIWGAIRYGESFIELSTITAGMLIEHVGFTLGDLPAHIKESPYKTFEHLFSNYGHFSRIQFDYLMSLYQMHSRLGILHADLHYNNCSIFELFRFSKPGGTYEIIEGYEIGYVLAGKYYSFPYNGIHGCIIDMSRAVLGGIRGMLVDEFGEFMTERFMRGQKKYIMDVIDVHFTQFASKKHDDLSAAYDKYPEEFIRVASAIDTLCVGENIVRLSHEPSITTGDVKLAPEALKQAERVATRSRELFTSGMESLFTDNTNIAWPAKIIIEEVFAEFALTESTIAAHYAGKKLTDIINGDNPSDKTLEKGLACWNFSNPAYVAKLFERENRVFPKLYMDLIQHEIDHPLHIRSDDKLVPTEQRYGGAAVWWYV